MGSIFYIASVLNGLFFFLAFLFAVALVALVAAICCYYLVDEKTWKKWITISAITAVVTALLMIFVPDGDTYLKMKIADHPLVENIIELVDTKVIQELENTELIDYD